MRGGPWWVLVLAVAVGWGKGRGGGSVRASVDTLPTPASRSLAGAPGWLSFDELVALAVSVGFPPAAAEKAARIAWRESRGNPKATAIVPVPKPGNLPERSFGLWQVNTLASPQYDEARLLDPAYNAQAAYALSRGGTSWTPWNLR